MLDHSSLPFGAARPTVVHQARTSLREYVRAVRLLAGMLATTIVAAAVPAHAGVT